MHVLSGRERSPRSNDASAQLSFLENTQSERWKLMLNRDLLYSFI